MTNCVYLHQLEEINLAWSDWKGSNIVSIPKSFNWFLYFLLLARFLRNISTTSSSLPMSNHFTHCLQTNGDSYLEFSFVECNYTELHHKGVRYSPAHKLSSMSLHLHIPEVVRNLPSQQSTEK